MDRANFLEQLIGLLAENDIRYCIIGGQAVNAYVDPVASLDLDLVVVLDQLEEVETLLRRHFCVKKFAHCLDVSQPDSDLRVQIRTDLRHAKFVDRGSSREILGMSLPVAAAEDVLQGKIWATLDPERRASKRQKDLADIARLIETYPNLAVQVPVSLRERLL